MDIVGFAGSIRARSFNKALLRAASELTPPGMSIKTFSIADAPLYNSDLDETFGGGPYPRPVALLRTAVSNADGVLLVTPEYNWGPSGVLKNAIDWLSRPANASPLHHKPVALMGTSPGPAGTGRAQLQLRQWLLSTRSNVLLEPDVQLGGAAKLFDDDLRLVDERARDAVAEQLSSFERWIRLHRPVIELDTSVDLDLVAEPPG